MENGRLTILNMSDILPNRFQPRIHFDLPKLEELAASINKYGVIEPIVVRPVGSKFEIVAGERRFKASKLANKSTIPAIIINLSDKDSEELALLENVQRQNLNPIEEAVSYKRILSMGYLSRAELSHSLGQSESLIFNKIKLLDLDDEVQKCLLNGQISERHARSLLKVTNRDEQVKLLHRIINERLTVKQTDEEIEKLNDTPEVEDLFTEFDTQKGDDFMDIEKIMREAQDINKPSKPKDLSTIVGSSTLGGNNDISRSIESTGNVGSYQVDSNLGSYQVNSNDDQNKFVTFVPPTFNEPVKPVNNNVSFNSIFGQNPEPAKNPVFSEKESNNISNAVASAFKNFSKPVKPEPTFNSVSSLNSASSDNASVNIAPNLNSNFGVNGNSINNTETFNSNFSSNTEPTFNVNLNNGLFNSIPDTNIYNDVKQVNDTTSVTPVNNFAKIVKLLRECADQIEANGYKVSTDELDLGNQYKVTFVIDKE